MKYIGKVDDTPHAKEIYDIHITKAEMETLDLILSLYTPFISSNMTLLIDNRDMSIKYRLKSLRYGINKIKRAIKEEK